ncbi:MAG: SWF/SNF helicase family protein [Proteobacteria bacterium]|nr:SWF/SNF helicase family protein [Pseudomonadota bacterium]
MLEILHRMRGVSLHPDRDEGVDPTDRASIETWLSRSARLSKAAELLKKIASHDEKAIVFVEDLGVQRVFAEAMATMFDLDHIPGRIDGGVSGDKRQKIVNDFQSAPRGFDLLVLSPRAAGVGLTITAANHVIHLSRWWNPAVEDQCNDRAYRIGQRRDVTIHLPLAMHPDLKEHSFDKKLDLLLEAKRALSRDMLAPPVGEGDLDRLFGDVFQAVNSP